VDSLQVLKTLGIEPLNNGACAGPDQWLSSKHAKKFDSINPSDGKIIASIIAATEKEYESVVEQSVNAFKEWRLVPAPKRGEVIRQLGDLLRIHKDSLGKLVALEMGKSKQEGDGEVQEMIDMADYAVGLSRQLYGKTMHSERSQHRMYEQWHPLGVVGVITAFNFPVAVWSWNAFIAAVCGNCVIWRPSSKVPLCAIAVQHLCNQVLKAQGLPGIFSLIISETTDLADRLIDDVRLPMISFTGSIKIGKEVAKNVGQRLGRSLLELSGNNAIIVDETVDLNLAIRAIVFGAVGTAGQRCTTTRRLFIHHSMLDVVVARLMDAYKQITIGNPLNEHILMGPLINKLAVDKYKNAINIIRKQGGTIIAGGNTLPGPGYFVEPTLVRVDSVIDIMREETFAPILYIMGYRTFEEALSLHNDVTQGLSSALFTTQLQRAETFLSASGSDCGIANINIGTSGAEIGGAFGGEKDTGGGREAGSDAWKNYMRRQTNTINWSNQLPLAQGIRFNIGE
jgi:aldehyde dehydrogenase (NAD+)